MPDLLPESDEAVLEKIFKTLSQRVNTDPYGEDSSFAEQIRQLPPGLRAMAATQSLDISLALDDIGWHFGNFGEPNHAEETEIGLRELGLNDLADWFHEAGEIMQPHRARIRGDNYTEVLKAAGHLERIEELSRRAWSLGEESGERLNGSPIYAAWVRYARTHPDRIF